MHAASEQNKSVVKLIYFIRNPPSLDKNNTSSHYSKNAE